MEGSNGVVGNRGGGGETGLLPCDQLRGWPRTAGGRREGKIVVWGGRWADKDQDRPRIHLGKAACTLAGQDVGGRRVGACTWSVREGSVVRDGELAWLRRPSWGLQLTLHGGQTRRNDECCRLRLVAVC